MEFATLGIVLAVISIVLAILLAIFQEPLSRLWDPVFKRNKTKRRLYWHIRRSPYEKFIGRENELKELIIDLKNEKLIVVHGMGGVGKTSLVLRVIEYLRLRRQSLSKRLQFDAFIWTSAQSRVFTADGPVISPGRTQTLEDIFSSIGIALHRYDIYRAPPEIQPQLVLNALSKQKTLLVIDNLDEIKDKRVISFVKQVPTTTRVIITTRFELGEGVQIKLDPLPELDSIKLVDYLLGKHKVSLSDEEYGRLIQGGNGIPLALEYAIAQMKWGHSISYVLDLISSDDGVVLDYLFSSGFELLKEKSAHFSFLALSFFPAAASREAIIIASSEEKEDRGSKNKYALLERLSLIKIEDDRIITLPITRDFAASELINHSGWEESARIRWTKYFSALMEESTQLATHNDRFDIVDADRENILAIFEWGFEDSSDLEKFWSANTFHLTSRYLYARGYWSHLIKYHRWAAEELLVHKEMDAFLETLLGWPVRVYLHWKKYEPIDESFQRATHALNALNINNGFQRALLDYYWAGLARRRGGPADVIQPLNKVISIFDTSNRPRWTTSAWIRLGDAYLAQKTYDDAEDCYKQVLEICNRQTNHYAWVSEHLALANANLGILANAREDYSSAKPLLVGAHPALSELSDLCIIYMETAICHYFLGLERRAWEFGLKSRRLSNQLGFVDRISESKPDWEQIILPQLEQKYGGKNEGKANNRKD